MHDEGEAKEENKTVGLYEAVVNEGAHPHEYYIGICTMVQEMYRSENNLD